ncbi:MAG: CDP-diacylglycerol--glycerol-3-phosphate 3-phosphatidyltransferase [Clostridia bacterium]|nr:CDP-diacylglycerol--glycerol-3-phosphate 3-phosphatidyltransferase [Clostridia bacterium]
MNLPNRLTLLRIVLVPVMVLLCALSLWPWALAVFFLAAVTDTLDGYLARRYGLVTDFGKFLDPVADKALVVCAFICLCAAEVIPAWFVCLTVFRDLIVDGLRLSAAGKGAVVAAALPGKIKTVLQMVLAAWAFLSLFLPLPAFVLPVLIAAAALMTAWSGILYFIRLKDSLFDKDL